MISTSAVPHHGVKRPKTDRTRIREVALLTMTSTKLPGKVAWRWTRTDVKAAKPQLLLFIFHSGQGTEMKRKRRQTRRKNQTRRQEAGMSNQSESETSVRPVLILSDHEPVHSFSPIQNSNDILALLPFHGR